jgi:hypothetical protein
MRNAIHSEITAKSMGNRIKITDSAWVMRQEHAHARRCQALQGRQAVEQRTDNVKY